jgi:hypothetical protein
MGQLRPLRVERQLDIRRCDILREAAGSTGRNVHFFLSSSVAMRRIRSCEPSEHYFNTIYPSWLH